MDNNKFERYIEKTLKEEEYKVDELQKERMWQELEEQLSFEKEKKKKPYWIGLVSTAAAILILASGLLFTTPGHALVDTVIKWFEPEKQVKIPMEGSEEEETATLNDQSEKGYVIYVDEEHYKLEEHEKYDLITTKEPLPEQYPEVSMKIIHEKDQPVEDTIRQLEAEYDLTFESTDYPIDAQTARTIDGQEWNSPVNRFFVISDKNGGSYIFHQKYFLEASEGHGVRLSEMLKEFHIVEK
ncbi:hypothetical protein ACSVDE_12795 [Pseudalkalibacillus sp. Hm43]|uniref:hypothetical protein n=1 Tax=Pseudalkalibacillus sp. Hm43 TaxID=3450742 RepID=UPI003F42E427